MNRDLDNYITGHYGEDQFRNIHDEHIIEEDVVVPNKAECFDDTCSHNDEDGPEVDVIKTILAKHPFYSAGKEARDIELSIALEIASVAILHRSYDLLHPEDQSAIRARVARILAEAAR